MNLPQSLLRSWIDRASTYALRATVDKSARPAGKPAVAAPAMRSVLSILGRAYGACAVARRTWITTRPDRRRRLERPVISVGNLAVGGSGKTPLVAHIAALLREQGHRPSILTRGYRRRFVEEGVVVVRDRSRILADLDRAGDEPLMLARALEGVAVLVCPDRYLAGRLAERRLGCTVHILDDGFQHVALSRDLDIVIASPGDLAEGALLPEGRLREPIQTISQADAVVLLPGTAAEAHAAAERLGVRKVFAARRTIGVPRMVEPYGEAPRVGRDAPILALAGVARPERFFEDLSAAGWRAVDSMVFPDHHAYSPRDVVAIADRARASGAELVLTTEKDVVRLLPHRPLSMKVAWVPLTLAFDPPDRFDAWIVSAV